MPNSGFDLTSVNPSFIVNTAQARTALEAALPTATHVAIDTETCIIRDADGEPVPVDFDVDGPGPTRVMSLATRHDDNGTPRYATFVFDVKTVALADLADILESTQPYGWNASFDRVVLKREGVSLDVWRDGILAERVLNAGAIHGTGGPNSYPSLDWAAKRYLGHSLSGKDDTRMSYNMQDDLTHEQIKYAGIDALATLLIGIEQDRLLTEADLLNVAELEYRANPFVHAMKVDGLPLDLEGYQREIDAAAKRLTSAGETVALLTGETDLLRALLIWSAQQGHITASEQEVRHNLAQDANYLKEHGLPLLKNTALFNQFRTWVAGQRGEILKALADLHGAKETEDLFSDGKRYDLPFNVDDGGSIRRWLKKVAPQFTAEYLATHGGGVNLLKSHDMNDVLTSVASAPTPDVTTVIARTASLLNLDARYAGILAKHSPGQSAALSPSWNLNSPVQVRDALNTYAQEAVLAYTESRTGIRRLLDKSDSVDDASLSLIGGNLAEAILDHRHWAKIVSTYGDSLIATVHPRTGRIHGKYEQAIASTGRLASSKPNMQNLSPLAKPYMGLARTDENGRITSRIAGNPTRVLVCADLSQAELRFAAALSGDTGMLEAFASGEDLHTRTATSMFGVPLLAIKDSKETLAELVAEIPELAPHVARGDGHLTGSAFYSQSRGRTKKTSFGYCYGLAAPSLATQLTVDGIPTTPEEGKSLLESFDRTYPDLAAYMRDRVAYVRNQADSIRDGSADTDYIASWRLHKLYARVIQARNELKARTKQDPTSADIARRLISDERLAELMPGAATEAIAAERSNQIAQIEWAAGHYGSVVLRTDGTPWGFESRNVTGRRRLFQVSTNDWAKNMAFAVARSNRPNARAIATAWQDAWNSRPENSAGKTISLTKEVRGKVTSLTYDELDKVFANRDIVIDFVSHVLNSYSDRDRQYLFREGMASSVRRMTNQYRNHPIQSGVADAVLEAYARLWPHLNQTVPTALPVQSVHDSIVIECDASDALTVKAALIELMEAPMRELVPAVTVKADCDVQLNLDPRSIVPDSQLENA